MSKSKPLSIINTYEEACPFIKEVGVLPLSSFIPDHPSLESVTPKENWFTGTEVDPWLWRAVFPGEGVAAYGKFLRKKSTLISRELFPYMVLACGQQRSIAERYEAGLMSKAAVDIHTAIKENPAIETRALRAKVGMKAKEQKKEFDRALFDLQGSLDIVISGVKARFNEKGEQYGWNSTSFELTEQWMSAKQVAWPKITPEEAKAYLMEALEQKCSPKAWIYISKSLPL